MRSTAYADLIADADDNGHRIERIFVKEHQSDEIRFSWWKDGNFQTRPLDLGEDELIVLIRKAILAGVFSEQFMQELQIVIYETRRDAKYAKRP